jgi:hypothetical protein
MEPFENRSFKSTLWAELETRFYMLIMVTVTVVVIGFIFAG